MKLLSLAVAFLLSTTAVKAQVVTPADELVNDAIQRAGAEHKNAIIIFHASWCGWCHKMDSALNDISIKKFFDDNYIITHITVQESKTKKQLENPGGDELSKKYHSEKAGLPFWVILDKDGKLLGDSFIRPTGASLDVPGENIGCPSEASEVAAFTDLLKKTSKLNDQQLGLISERFKQNAAH